VADDQPAQEETDRWTRFYEARDGQPVRPLLTRVLGFIAEAGGRPGRAIDLGCGEGTDTVELLKQGWNVLALDSSEEGIARTRQRAAAVGLGEQLETQCAQFEEIDSLPSAGLVYAGVSLPFCAAEHFGRLWQQILAAVQPAGWIAAQFFGPNDTWAGNDGMTFHSREELTQLFAEFDVRVFEEFDEDGQAVSGPKHWHRFDVIAAPVAG